MNRSALATFSLATAVAVMTLGYANVASAAKPDCALNPSHPSCKDDDGGGGADGATFNVTILGNELVGGSGEDPWAESFGGKNTIGLNDASGLDVGTLTGLSSFTGELEYCFPSDFLDPHTSNFQLHQAFIKPGKKGRAEASLWFHGATDDGTVRVLYLLKLFGDFDPNEEWPGAQTLKMTTWELKVENEGKTIKDMSCQSDEVMEGLVTITVK